MGLREWRERREAEREAEREAREDSRLLMESYVSAKMARDTGRELDALYAMTGDEYIEARNLYSERMRQTVREPLLKDLRTSD